MKWYLTHVIPAFKIQRKVILRYTKATQEHMKLCLKYKPRVSEMAQLLKVLAAKSDNLSLIPMILTVKEASLPTWQL